MNNKLCILIISFDKYLHLAEMNYLSILKYWPENKYNVYHQFIVLADFEKYGVTSNGPHF